ncbi:MAG: hypothetical protein RQ736_14185 [Thiogranum sp.]|nr:hypothetical protein [Thiogranum sp.]
MRDNSQRGTRMITLRLGHFVGAGNRLGMVPAIVPRLKTFLVPWLGGGKKRLPMIADTDLGVAFALATTAKSLNDYESFNICGPEFPTLREVITCIAELSGAPKPLYAVPYVRLADGDPRTCSARVFALSDPFDCASVRELDLSQRLCAQETGLCCKERLARCSCRAPR